MTTASTTASNSRKGKRIVHIVETMELGGMERMIATLAEATQHDGFDVRVLCMKANGPVGEALAARGIPVTCADVPRDKPDYLAFRRVARQLRAMGADVAHTHNTPGLLFGAAGARLAGIRHIVHTEHGRHFPDRMRYMVAERLASAWVRHVVGVSESVTANLRRFEWIPARKLRTIPNGVEAAPASSPDIRARIREELGVSPSTPIVGTAGRLVWEKGLPHLLRAWQTVGASRPDSLLVIVGDGPLRRELELLTDELDIRARVRFTGARSDVPALLQSLRLFVMPSVSEGLPLALLEAMAAALPIVATTIGGMPAALDEGKAGVLVPAADANALAQAIVSMLGDDALSRQLGANARRRFEEHFTAAAMARSYESLYMNGSAHA